MRRSARSVLRAPRLQAEVYAAVESSLERVLPVRMVLKGSLTLVTPDVVVLDWQSELDTVAVMSRHARW